ncbi:uncharacterized protein LOC110834354 isoform X1 [Zootermopsis nevadensis]|nr:uncharacterized protein LOC110834354 isoform X1 [Zootermopsis nevadensis]
MRLPLVTLLSVILLTFCTAASPREEEHAPRAGVDGGESSSGGRWAPSVPRDVQTSSAAERASLARNGEVAATTTEAMGLSPVRASDGLSWNVAGSPRQRSSSDSPEMITIPSSLSSIQSDRSAGKKTLSSADDTGQSSSSNIEVSGILISIDGVPTLGPFDEPNTESSSQRTNRAEETISLGPVEIFSILHEIISTSILQSDNDEPLRPTTSDTDKINSSSSVPVKQPSAALTYPINYVSEKHDIDKATMYSEPRLSPSPVPAKQKHDSTYHGPLESSNPYAHWDSDSEEQEREMEMQRPHDENNAATRTSGLTPDAGTEHSTSTPTTGRSYLLLLAGNSTIVQLRQKDFAKYLKLNLAARLSLEYDDVRVNRVVLAPPQLLVNVSVVTPSEAAVATDPEQGSVHDDALVKEEAPLHMMAETNATLLELSGEEYHVVRLLPLHSYPSNKKPDEDEDNPPTSSAVIRSHHSDIELLMYTAVGSAFALGILATLFITFSRYTRIKNIPWPWHRPKCLCSSWTLPSSHLRHRRMAEYPSVTAAPPPVIYSGSFAARAASNSSGNSWVDEYQTQSSVILADGVASAGGAAMLGVEAMKFPARDPLYTDAEMGDAATSVIVGHYADTPRHHSPCKLHIFSCSPGSIVIPAPMLTSHHQVRRNLADNYQPLSSKAAKDSHHLDVRIRDDCRLGHENPNYQT